MMATRRERLIPDATGGLAIRIMVCAFLLSFASLLAGAVQAGISPRNRLHRCPAYRREPDDPPALAPAGVSPVRVAGGCYVSGMSIGFPIAHRPEDFISPAVHAVPPITQMVSIGMFTMIIRSDLRHGGYIVSVSHVPLPEVEVPSPDVILPKRK